jgi:hypothetical protein
MIIICNILTKQSISYKEKDNIGEGVEGMRFERFADLEDEEAQGSQGTQAYQDVACLTH